MSLLFFAVLMLEPQAAADVAPQAAHESATNPTKLETVRITLHGGDDETLVDELELRLPGVSLTSSGRAAAYVDVSIGEAMAELHVVVDDGRGYFREIELGDTEERERSLANSIALLLSAIEDGTAEPPDTTRAKPPMEQRADQIKDFDLEKEAAPMEGEVERDESGEAPSDNDPSLPPSREIASYELGLTASTWPVLSLGAPKTDVALGAWAGSLTMDGRFRRGALLSFDFAVMGRSVDNLRLTRFRIAVGGGYGLRVHSFEMIFAAYAFAQPWLTRSSGKRARPTNPTLGQAPVALFGGFARLSPGYFVRLNRIALRVGGRVELGGGGIWDEGAGVPRITTETERRVRLGGFELSVGVGVTVWVPVALK